MYWFYLYVRYLFWYFFRLTRLRVKESHSRFKVMKRWNPQNKKSSNMVFCFTVKRIEFLLTFNCLQLFIVTCVYTWYIIYNMYIMDMIKFFSYSNITKFIMWLWNLWTLLLYIGVNYLRIYSCLSLVEGDRVLLDASAERYLGNRFQQTHFSRVSLVITIYMCFQLDVP